VSEVVSRASAEPQMVEAGRPVNAEGRTADAISAAGAKRAEFEDLVRQIAMDIGKEVVAYVEVMYPQAITATSSTFKLSLRNIIYNQVMAAIEVTNEGEIRARLQERAEFRRWWVNQYRKIRRKKIDGAG